MSYSSTTLYAFYDLGVSPISFDFVSFLVCAEQARITAGASDIKFVIVPFEAGSGHHDNKQFDATHGDWRLHNVVVPMCNLLSTPSGITICGSRKEAEQIQQRFADHIFPPNYSVDTPLERHHTGWSIIAAHRGEVVHCLRGSEQARSYARQWIDQHAGGKKCVALTLREAPFGTFRNSDIVEWAKFADLLRDKEYFPVLLRDIDTALDPTPEEFGDIAIFPEGVFNLELRVGFYEECDICAFVANGPAQVCWYNANVRFLYQVTGDWLDQKPTPFNRIGIDFDETPPVANHFQRWIWKPQKAETLYSEFLRLESDLETSRSDGTYDTKLLPVEDYKKPLGFLSERFLNWASRAFFTSSQEVALAQECLGDKNLNQLDGKDRLLNLFNTALQANDLEKAGQYLVMMKDKLGLSSDICVKMGIVNEAQGNFDLAIDCYRSAIELGENEPSVLFRLATTHTNLNQFEEAAAIYESLIQAGAKSIRITVELGKIYEHIRPQGVALQFYADAAKNGINDDTISQRIAALS